ncbi:unnamed protein product [Arabidopsis lyrata]|nr:unnamed protein product [Arabidopsis lyrata]
MRSYFELWLRLWLWRGKGIAYAALFPFFGENYGEVSAMVVASDCHRQNQGDRLLDYIEKKASIQDAF